MTKFESIAILKIAVKLDLLTFASCIFETIGKLDKKM
jgi:hypothetical protein